MIRFAKGNIYFESIFFVFCSLLSATTCLNLPHQATSKPKHFTSTTTPAGAPPVVTKAPSGVSLYEIKESEDSPITCILFRTDALVEIKFDSVIGEEKGDSYIPDNPLIDGKCNDDDAVMMLMWEKYRLIVKFSKTPGGERWYIANVELSINTEMPVYQHLKSRGHTVKLYHDAMVLPTPVGKSYKCDEVVIDLAPASTSARYTDNLRGTLYLRELQLQAFMYKGTSFGPVFECNVGKTFRDETAPIAVGSTLAIVALATVTGYGVFRYYKIKKVQYNTME